MSEEQPKPKPPTRFAVFRMIASGLSGMVADAIPDPKVRRAALLAHLATHNCRECPTCQEAIRNEGQALISAEPPPPAPKIASHEESPRPRRSPRRPKGPKSS